MNQSIVLRVLMVNSLNLTGKNEKEKITRTLQIDLKLIIVALILLF